jgi:alpha-mannosidase
VYSLPQDNSDQIIHIHLIPHSHNDAGWLYTFKEYYDGLDYRYCTKCELDTIFSEMQVEKTRTFSWSEISFFKLWYNGLSDESKLIVKDLVSQKRFEFVGGAWVMNDEATTNYQNIIDQIRLGLLWLKEEFNVLVKTAWLLDTFGHSISHVKIYVMIGSNFI